MAKEILLYETIYNWTARWFIEQMQEAKSEDIEVRINTPGGNPIACWGMIAKMKEHSKDLLAKVDGGAYSMGAFFLLYVSKAECLDVSEFLFHRAAYSAMTESSLTEDERLELEKVNKHLRAAFEAKIDVAKFEAISGVTVDQLFDPKSRVDVKLNATQAKDIGLVQKINSIQPKEIEALSHKYFQMAAEHKLPESKEEKPKIEKPQNKIKMTLEQFKAEHPEIFAQARKEGIAAERDRAGAWLAYADADIEAVKTGIEGGENISQKMQAEMNIKMFANTKLKEIETDSEGKIEAKKDKPEIEGKSEKKEIEALKEFDAAVSANFKTAE